MDRTLWLAIELACSRRYVAVLGPWSLRLKPIEVTSNSTYGPSDKDSSIRTWDSLVFLKPAFRDLGKDTRHPGSRNEKSGLYQPICTPRLTRQVLEICCGGLVRVQLITKQNFPVTQICYVRSVNLSNIQYCLTNVKLLCTNKQIMSFSRQSGERK